MSDRLKDNPGYQALLEEYVQCLKRMINPAIAVVEERQRLKSIGEKSDMSYDELCESLREFYKIRSEALGFAIDALGGKPLTKP